VNRGVKPFQVVKLLAYVLPSIILFALPAVTLMAVLVSFMRLSSDNEIISMKALGISLYQLLPPVLLVSFLCFLFAGFITIVGIPWGNRSFKDGVFKMVASNANAGVKEGVFSEPFEDIVFYINSLSPNGKIMNDVFVLDKRDTVDTNSIVAEQAKIVSHPDSRAIVVRFINGAIYNLKRDTLTVRTVYFKSYDLNIDLVDIMAALTSRKRGPIEMTFRELIEQLKSTPRNETAYNELAIELIERLSIPIAVLFMGILGIPLGAQTRRGGRSIGILVSLVIFLLYYMCLMGAKSMGESGVLSPFIGIWIPDIFLVVCCSYLFYKVANEKRIWLLGRV
jgi:lipopolysaccharide export system permease protein